MEFIYYGHACFAVKTNNTRLLFDPFITGNPSAAVKADKIEADYILLSHGHADHAGDCERIAKRTGATVITIAELADRLADKGLASHGMNIGGQANFSKGKFTLEKGDLRVKCVVAQHSSDWFEPGPDGKQQSLYGGNPMGFIVYVDNIAFYYAGDTGLTMDMQLIPRWAKLDFAVLPIGDNYTMGPEDALECARMINCNTIIGVHYDTFGFIKIDKKHAQDIFNKAGCELKLPAPGESITINQ